MSIKEVTYKRQPPPHGFYCSVPVSMFFSKGGTGVLCSGHGTEVLLVTSEMLGCFRDAEFSTSSGRVVHDAARGGGGLPPVLRGNLSTKFIIDATGSPGARVATSRGWLPSASA